MDFSCFNERRATQADATLLSRIAQAAGGAYVPLTGHEASQGAVDWAERAENSEISIGLELRQDHVWLSSATIIPGYRRPDVVHYLFAFAGGRALAHGKSELRGATSARWSHIGELHRRLGFAEVHCERRVDRTLIVFARDVGRTRAATPVRPMQAP